MKASGIRPKCRYIDSVTIILLKKLFHILLFTGSYKRGELGVKVCAKAKTPKIPLAALVSSRLRYYRWFTYGFVWTWVKSTCSRIHRYIKYG